MVNWEANGFPNPDTKMMECHVQERHTAFYKTKTKVISHFTPTVTGKYLFIFYKLKEDNVKIRESHLNQLLQQLIKLLLFVNFWNKLFITSYSKYWR